MAKPIITYWPNGKKRREEWIDDLHEMHRVGLPALEIHNDHGKLLAQRWVRHGLTHRLEGPAIIEWSESGREYEYRWFLDGQYYPTKITKNDHFIFSDFPSKEEHPFFVFRKDYKLPLEYEEWDDGMKALFALTYG